MDEKMCIGNRDKDAWRGGGVRLVGPWSSGGCAEHVCGMVGSNGRGGLSADRTQSRLGSIRAFHTGKDRG